MSDFVDDTPESDADEVLEFLREGQEKVNDTDYFMNTYGFEHKCRCAEDYEEGNVGIVSACWAQMCDDALEACKYYKVELEKTKLELAELQATTQG